MWRCLLVSLMGWLLAIPATHATRAPSGSVILERSEHGRLPRGWKFHHKASPTETLTLFVALKETKMRDLKDQLWQRFHGRGRGHNSFDHHLTRDQVNQLRKPNQHAIDDVSDWLRENGIRKLRTYESWIQFDATVQTAKALFETDLAYYVHTSGNTNSTPVLRTLSYSIPRRLHNDIDFVHPLNHFMPPRRRPGGVWPSPPAAVIDPVVNDTVPDLPCFTGTFPDCIKRLYNISYTAPLPSPARFGIAGFLEQWIMYNDTAAFAADYHPLIPPDVYNFTVEALNNGTNPQETLSAAGMEASLDVEYAMALGYPTAVTYYTTGGRGDKVDANGEVLPPTDSDNEPYLEFLLALLAKPDSELPHVLSISYADDEQSVPRAYALRVCDMFAALAARGVSVFAATGDGGAAGTGQTSCASNDGTGRKMYMPTFPASCPFVTAVGATSNVGPPVTAAGFSSGGFSNYFTRPGFQDELVAPFVDGLVKGKDVRLGLFNASGRATPDISAIGSGFQIVYGGRMLEVLGTSASTPVVAAMVALVNDARLRAGKGSLGWINPLLYGEGVRKVLTDVKDGTSGGCNFADGTQVDGWPAAAGWDASTGLGTVGDFDEFLKAMSV
ncbi:tripeptidyl-peptidase-like protein [Cercophora scortea]|uniref:tripeptidyl-peptidase II n=1 Tax=Cercophora scortea TaxID=314031 RepID=A0AAE0M8F5_9PEZI|nr:tripeptidyl-peptidase-like protein [Cercophora scortea]